jgi:predicted RNA-binding Zn-ribbon protein involved in translation (DUF1610 family)
MEIRRDIGNRRWGALSEWQRPPAREHLVAHACFTCRKVFRKPYAVTRSHVCPNCGGTAHEMGRSFKAPSRFDLEQWKKVRILFAHGFRFFSYRNHECEPLPDRLRDVEAFIAEHPEHPFRVADDKPDLLAENDE